MSASADSSDALWSAADAAIAVLFVGMVAALSLGVL